MLPGNRFKAQFPRTADRFLQVEKELKIVCVCDEGRLIGSLRNEEVETEGYSKDRKNSYQEKHVLEEPINGKSKSCSSYCLKLIFLSF